MSRQIVLTGGQLVIDFTWQGDRFGHTIGVDAGGAFVALLESIEGAATEKWPASPAFQDAHVETRGADQVAMLVGQAGKSHWSLSCEVAIDATARFDVACRYKLPPERLVSTYRVLGPTPETHVDQQAVEFAVPGAEAKICMTALTRRTHLFIDASENRLTFSTTMLDAPPATARWTYEIACRARLDQPPWAGT